MSIDPNRVAVIPFRITTADSLLGEGLAELLAGEFTGEGGPRSVDMATMISAWRHAGGGLRTPLKQDAARRLAREVGAGLLCEGSIVGIGSRVTITADLISATSNGSRSQSARAAGSADSIEVLLDELATSLLGSSTGDAQARVRDATHVTKVPAALRAYFEGLALERRGLWGEAASALDRSIAADSSFAQAVYQRWFLGLAGSLSSIRAARLVRTLHDRLGPRERTVLDGYFGVTGGPRPPTQILADRRAAAEQLGDSPEAWFLYGDYIFHFALAALDPDSILPMARFAFSKAAALDSQPVFLFHAFEVALHQRDSAVVRHLVRTYERIPDEWPRRWIGAAFLGDAELLDRARRTKPTGNTSVQSLGDFALANAEPISLTRLDEGFRRLIDVAPPSGRSDVLYWQWLVHLARGQPTTADRIAAMAQWKPYAGDVFAYLVVSGDANTDAALLSRFPAASVSGRIEASRRECFETLNRLSRGIRDTAAASPVTTSGGPTRCGRIAQIWRATFDGRLPDSLVASLDTLVHRSAWNNFVGYEHRLLARVYEDRGDLRAALAAIRLYPRDFPGVWSAPTAREEGRLAALAGDTLGAIHAYRRYLALYADAEPPLAAQRDSVHSVVAALKRRR